MPKQIIEINPFHGGLNNNGDPRDIKVEELSQAQDIMIDEIGKVRMMGSHVAHDAATKSVTIAAGHGLFYFSHDRLGAHDFATGQASTGEDYLAMANADSGADIEIFSNSDDSWSASPRIDLGTTTSPKAVYYYADGNLRVGDANFGAGNRVQWFGYIDRRFYGDGTDGYDTGDADNGLLVDTWYTTNANLEPIPIQSIFGHADGDTPAALNPISVEIKGKSDSHRDVRTSNKPLAENDSLRMEVDWASGQITDSSSSTGDFDNFFTIGDTVVFKEATSSLNNNKYFTIKTVSGTVVTFNESVDGIASNDDVYCYNLSKSQWFNSEDPNFEIAVSTLYDDIKQESPLSFAGTIYGDEGSETASLPPFMILNPTSSSPGSDGDGGIGKLKLDLHVFTELYTGDGSSGIHSNHPRVSGFKIYMRRENTSTWYLQSEIDITKGNKWFERGGYNMWDSGGTGLQDCAHCEGEFISSMRQIETYETETGFDQENSNIGFNANGLGFKTAVVANRRAYVGNVSIKDDGGIVRVLQDAILKSRVNSFDAFSIRDKIEATVNDGSSIVKLEEYADRLLEFKQDKMTLINISQNVEFLEDIFMHKGVVYPCAVCKTDYGIAWANENGCYLYDGQRVNDLLEKGGVQIIKESTWRSFIGAVPMVGYIPKKRQIIVAKTAGSEGVGDIYLYDLVTKSWVKGDSKLTDSVRQTNFVTDWNGDLVHAHTSGTVVKWDDTSAASSNLEFGTKDMTFGQPGQRKKLHKVYITYKGDGSSVVAKYAIDGETDSGDFLQFNSTNTPLADKSSSENLESWHLAELKPTTSSEANNLYSAKFHLSGTAGAGFEVNDINVVFRMKNIK